LLLAVEANLVEQVADFSPRPQVLDELAILAAARGEVHLVDVLSLLGADRPCQRDGDGPLPRITAEDDELAAREQVGKLPRVDLREPAGVARRQLQIGQDWLTHLRV